MQRETHFKTHLEDKGFSLAPFPNSLRSEMLAHIENHIRELGAKYTDSSTAVLKDVALSVPDSIWSEKMSRAYRIFPKSISHKIEKWANDSIRPKLDRTQSAINKVYREEIKINDKLDADTPTIYWRCVRPGKPDAGRPHRDADFWDLEFKAGYDPQIPFQFNYLKDCVKIWIPLQGCIPTTTLQVISGSHKMEISAVVETTEYGTRPTINSSWLEEHKNDYISPVELSKGECIIFDMKLVHRGPQHNNSDLRLSAELCFILKPIS